MRATSCPVDSEKSWSADLTRSNQWKSHVGAPHREKPTKSVEARGGGVQRRMNRGREVRKLTRATEKSNTEVTSRSKLEASNEVPRAKHN